MAKANLASADWQGWCLCLGCARDVLVYLHLLVLAVGRTCVQRDTCPSICLAGTQCRLEWAFGDEMEASVALWLEEQKQCLPGEFSTT